MSKQGTGLSGLSHGDSEIVGLRPLNLAPSHINQVPTTNASRPQDLSHRTAGDVAPARANCGYCVASDLDPFLGGLFLSMNASLDMALNDLSGEFWTTPRNGFGTNTQCFSKLRKAWSFTRYWVHRSMNARL